jgi:hypothetical protein
MTNNHCRLKLSSVDITGQRFYRDRREKGNGYIVSRLPEIEYQQQLTLQSQPLLTARARDDNIWHHILA